MHGPEHYEKAEFRSKFHERRYETRRRFMLLRAFETPIDRREAVGSALRRICIDLH
jgi:hypothetical protein